MKTKENILLIRKGENNTIKDDQELKNAIIHNYPNLKFKILLLNNIKQDNVVDNHIIHKYWSQSCFIKYNEKKDIWYYESKKTHSKSYDCVYQELKKINSEKFEQPKHRDA